MSDIRDLTSDQENEYERIVLAYILRDKAFLEKAISKRIKVQWFINRDYRDLFKIISHYYFNKEEIITKSVLLDMVRNSPSVQPQDYVKFDEAYESIVRSYKDEHSFDYYFNKFRDDSIYTYFLDCCNKVIGDRDEQKENMDGSIKWLMDRLHVLMYGEEDKEWKSIDYIQNITDQLEDIKNRKDNPDDYAGIKTYMPSVDKFFNGFERGTLTIFAGRPGTGKSTIMKSIAWKQCINKKNVLIVSCEDHMLIWSHKITSAEKEIPLTDILRGQITDKQYETIVEYKEKRMEEVLGNTDHIGKYNILQLSARKFTVPNLETLIETHMEEWVPDIIYVDQISLILPTVRMKHNVDMEFGEVTKDLRRLAMKWNIPVVAASQVNRGSIQRDKEGSRVVDIDLENLSQSDMIGQDADNAFAIEMNSKQEGLCTLKLIKQRTGPKDKKIPLRFSPDFCDFKDAEEILEDAGGDSAVGDHLDPTSAAAKAIEDEDASSMSIVDELGAGLYESIMSGGSNNKIDPNASTDAAMAAIDNIPDDNSGRK